MKLSDAALSLLAGALAFCALSLLINPEVTGVRIAWGTFYGAF